MTCESQGQLDRWLSGFFVFCRLGTSVCTSSQKSLPLLTTLLLPSLPVSFPFPLLGIDGNTNLAIFTIVREANASPGEGTWCSGDSTQVPDHGPTPEIGGSVFSIEGTVSTTCARMEGWEKIVVGRSAGQYVA